MNRGLRHLALKTRDLPTTERFYVDILGLKRAFPHDGIRYNVRPVGRINITSDGPRPGYVRK
jgi:catechol 2,3-dioxygenase-like lactoylglutathione lyase family enzyme